MCGLNPATTQSAVQTCFTFVHSRLFSTYRPAAVLRHHPVQASSLELDEPGTRDSGVVGDRAHEHALVPLDTALEETTPLGERGLPQVGVSQGEEVEGHIGHRGLTGQAIDSGISGVDSLLERVEVESTRRDQDQLAVDNTAAGQRLPERADDLGEVPLQGSLVPAAQGDLVTVPEDNAAEPVPLGLVQQPDTFRDFVGGLGEHRLHGWHDRQIHASEPIRDSTGVPLCVIPRRGL